MPSRFYFFPGSTMTKNILLPLAALVALLPLQTKAIGIDPQGSWQTASASFESFSIATPSFTFGSDALGGGIVSFINVSGSEWVGVNINVDLAPGSIIGCGPAPYFTFCQVTSVPLSSSLDQFTIAFYQPTVGGGILPGETVSFNLNDNMDASVNLDPNGAGGWGPDNTFSAGVMTGSPEPASLLLILAGFGIVAAGRRFCFRG